MPQLTLDICNGDEHVFTYIPEDNERVNHFPVGTLCECKKLYWTLIDDGCHDTGYGREMDAPIPCADCQWKNPVMENSDDPDDDEWGNIQGFRLAMIACGLWHISKRIVLTVDTRPPWV